MSKASVHMAAGILAALAFSGSGELLRVPLMVANNSAAKRQRMAQAGAAQNLTQNGPPPGVLLDSTGGVQFFGAITVGSNSQTLKVIFDTGSGDVWVPNLSAASGKHRGFDTQTSKTFRSTGYSFEGFYAGGSASGTLCTDTVNIGPLTFPDFEFGVVEDTSRMNGYSDWGADGVAGMSMWSSSRRPTVVSTIRDATMGSASFAFYLGTAHAHELVLGGAAPEHYDGAFNYVKLNSVSLWKVSLTTATLGEQQVCDDSETDAIFDSGNSFVTGPSEFMEPILSSMGAQFEVNAYWVDCNRNIQPISFMFGDASFQLTKEDLIFDNQGDKCYIGLMPFDHPDLSTPAWILGVPFLKKYYVLFDWDARRVGIAPATQSTTRPTPEVLV